MVPLNTLGETQVLPPSGTSSVGFTTGALGQVLFPCPQALFHLKEEFSLLHSVTLNRKWIPHGTYFLFQIQVGNM